MRVVCILAALVVAVAADNLEWKAALIKPESTEDHPTTYCTDAEIDEYGICVDRGEAHVLEKILGESGTYDIRVLVMPDYRMILRWYQNDVPVSGTSVKLPAEELVNYLTSQGWSKSSGSSGSSSLSDTEIVGLAVGTGVVGILVGIGGVVVAARNGYSSVSTALM